WLLTPDQSSHATQIRAAGINSAELARMWAMFTTEFFERGDLKVEDRDNEMVVTSVKGEQSIACHVRRRTLTPRRYELFDGKKQRRFELVLSRYEMIGQIPWPK